jgi:hypothetical protein
MPNGVKVRSEEHKKRKETFVDGFALFVFPRIFTLLTYAIDLKPVV